MNIPSSILSQDDSKRGHRFADRDIYNPSRDIARTILVMFVGALSFLAAAKASASSASCTVGQSVTFSSSAEGTAPFTYQWYKGSTAISGATSDTYSIASVSLADAANYYVVISNSAGSATSDTAQLSVAAAIVAPSITSQPASQTITDGQTASFAVTATGSGVLSYQWKKNGTSISGANSSSYSIASATTSDGGTYSVTVSNSAGSITSTGATLVVNAAAVAPSITTQPVAKSVTAGQSASFSVVAAGTGPLTYQWRKNGVNISGTNSSTFSIASTNTGNAGSYSVVVSNSAGSVTSNAVNLTVAPVVVPPSIILQPTAQSVTAGQAASFSVTATGSATLTYQWRRNGVNVSGATSATLNLANVSNAQAGTYSVVVSNSAGSVTSTNVTLTVNAAPVGPSITTQPLASSVTAGQTASFSVTATGSATLKYQWAKDGNNISGATSSVYTIAVTATGDSGNYSVTVSNSVGSVTSTAVRLNVAAALIPPSITAQPTAQSITVGQAASFTVSAIGSPTISYQWKKNGTNVSGATSATFTISNAAQNDSANYTVVVTNGAGSVTSVPASLLVNAIVVAPSVTAQPTAQSVTIGQGAAFSVSATGSAPLNYQWYKNGSIISGAISPSYNVATTAAGDAGRYSVVISNSAGSVASDEVTLDVNPAPIAPVITSQPNPQAVTVGDSAFFAITATGSQPLTYQWQRNGENIGGATLPTFSIASASAIDAGNYSVLVTNTVGTSSSIAVNLTVNPIPSAPVANPTPNPTPDPAPETTAPTSGVGTPKLINISTRSYVGTGGDVMIAGFIIGGTSPKTVLIRASGPALAAFGVPGALTDPTIELHDSKTIIATNDNWGDDAQEKTLLQQAFQATNAFGWVDGSKDAAIVVNLDPGSYTAVVAGKNNATGVALIEAYEVDIPNRNSKLINISTRSTVKTDANVQIAGFIISGDAPKRVVIRASGPALTKYGVGGVLADPVMELHSGETVLAQNNDWDPSLRADFQAVGIDNWETGSKDAAIVTTLQPGGYSVIVSGKNGTTGVALVEVFEEN
ncbi:MAG TPA: immunoglobulin domain-containing protein [Opitutaceae bacterium]|nr:immunoglobulin domain-containing protein [Opitutaceae bacterium]